MNDEHIYNCIVLETNEVNVFDNNEMFDIHDNVLDVSVSCSQPDDLLIDLVTVYPFL